MKRILTAMFDCLCTFLWCISDEEEEAQEREDTDDNEA